MRRTPRRSHAACGKQLDCRPFTRANRSWLKESEKDGAHGKDPAHDGFGYVTYDTKKHQYGTWAELRWRMTTEQNNDTQHVD